jgi:hypothetical protein
VHGHKGQQAFWRTKRDCSWEPPIVENMTTAPLKADRASIDPPSVMGERLVHDQIRMDTTFCIKAPSPGPIAGIDKEFKSGDNHWSKLHFAITSPKGLIRHARA